MFWSPHSAKVANHPLFNDVILRKSVCKMKVQNRLSCVDNKEYLFARWHLAAEQKKFQATSTCGSKSNRTLNILQKSLFVSIYLDYMPF